MTAYSRRGFRVRLILENYADHRKKCFFFVNILREKYVRNVIQRIWHFFYKEHCSSPDELFLELDEFFIPPGESTFLLKENDLISVRVRPEPTGAAGSAVRSTVAPLTAAPATLVESVAHVLRRLQNGGEPEDSERSERDRLAKVAALLAAESGSSDVSTDDEGVRDLASRLTSRREVVRLSQKMADQATPPPPCTARKHNLDSEQLSLTEISRELRRRYEAARQPPTADSAATASCSAAPTAPHQTSPVCTSPGAGISPVTAAIALAASPGPSMSSLDSPTSLIEMARMLEASAETRGTASESPVSGRGTSADRAGTSADGAATSADRPGMSGGVATSTPFVTPSTATMPKRVWVSTVKRPTEDRSGEGQGVRDEDMDLDCGAALQQIGEVTSSGRTIPRIITVVPPGVRLDDMPCEAGRSRTVPGAPNSRMMYPEGVGRLSQNRTMEEDQSVGVKDNRGSLSTAEGARREVVVSHEDVRKRAQIASAEGMSSVKSITHNVPLNRSSQRPAEDAEVTPVGKKKLPVIVVVPGARKDVTPLKTGEIQINARQGQDVSEVKRHSIPVAGLKRGRSPICESSDSDSSSSEDESPVKSTPSKKLAKTPTNAAPTPASTPAVSDGASAEKKKKTRTRRRRGKKRRTPEETVVPPPPPAPQPRAGDYARRHGLPRGDIDRYKRSASVALGWQTRPRNRRVVFDDDGNAVPAGAESPEQTHAAERGWRGAREEAAGQWAWSQGRGQEQRADCGRAGRGGWSRPDGRTTNSSDQSGGRSRTEDFSGNNSTIIEDPDNVLTKADESANQTPVQNLTGAAPSTKNSCPVTQSTTISGTLASNANTSSSCTLSSGAAAGTPATTSLTSRGPGDSTSSGRPASSGACGAGRGGSLGAGLLPRAFMRPLRCIDPPRRSEVMKKPLAENRVESEGSNKLLQPDYLLASRAATSAASVSPAGFGAGRNVKRSESVQDDSCTAGTRRRASDAGDGADSPSVSRPSAKPGIQESISRERPCLVNPASASAPSTANATSRASSAANIPSNSSPASAPAAASPGLASAPVAARPAASARDRRPAPTPVSHSTVVLDGSGRPAEARDLHHLVTSAERRPLVVVRRDRPLPGRAPYREMTRQECRNPQRGKGSAIDAFPGSDVSGKSGTPVTPREGGATDDGGHDMEGEDGGGHRVDFDTGAEKLGAEAEDTDHGTSPLSGDVYQNVSVILPGPPLETLSPRLERSGGSAEDSEDSEDSGEESEDGQDSADEEEGPDSPLLTSAACSVNASVDSITNCNVVNAVGQNRRLEKQRARGLPPGGDKENQAPKDAVKDEKFYSQFPLMKEAARKGDLIAFKCWDMAADYTPYVSDYREATVMEAARETQGTTRLTLQLLEYRPRGRRRGRFEIASPDDDEVVDLEQESGVEDRRWSELIQPRLLHP